MPTKDEKKYHDDLINIVGCIICRNELGLENSLASIHHIKGRSKRRDPDCEWKVLPLCGAHHQTGGEGVAIHPFKRVWQQIYGSQEYLKMQCDKILKEQK